LFSERSFGENYMKRLFDIILSLISLLILFPLFVLIPLMIKIDSGGPVFFRQIRIGKKSKIFKIIKFRTMVKDAEKRKVNFEKRDPILKEKNDPRITQFGKNLRKYSLDEIPQFLNVLKGEMSIVGPRPLTPEDAEHYNLKNIKRFEIRPGITGLSQIKGRSDITLQDSSELDIHYIENHTFLMDIKILIKTIPVVLNGKGAY